MGIGKVDTNSIPAETSGSQQLVGTSSNEKNMNTSVPFLPETDVRASPDVSNKNFNDAISPPTPPNLSPPTPPNLSPPTPPNLTFREEKAERKALLKRPQISNGLSQSQVSLDITYSMFILC